ncbi:hypothetical protein ALC57_14185 [Trachymyrmex cornetzi]|uniref:GIY-YIG domain-containing protein n=1 Tax=Trachymyrmex cornetzi TaxID=471704 RepID=A0A151IYJ6_9HYME|nr:hypothetical protein ALC57_14185 [Trachymyrmex cornetzi]
MRHQIVDGTGRVKILLENDYPIDSIFDTINERVKTLINKLNSCSAEKTNNNLPKERVKWFSILYLEEISNKFKNAINGVCHRVSFFSLNKLNQFIKVHKDPLNNELKRNVVYKINCRDCDVSYVGQTRRKLKTRLSEHKKHIHSKTSTHSVITEHRLQNHDFDWQNVEILDVKNYHNKRLILEMMHINRQTNGLNLQHDTIGLNHAYIEILNKL